MPHMEYNPTLATWVQGPRQPPPQLPVVLQLHEQTYALFSTPRPMANLHSQPQYGPPTAYLEVSTQVLADTGVQMEVLTLAPIDSLGLDPNILFRVQLRGRGVVSDHTWTSWAAFSYQCAPQTQENGGGQSACSTWPATSPRTTSPA